MEKQYDLFRAHARKAPHRDGGQADRLIVILSGYSNEALAGFHRTLKGEAPMPKAKARLVEALAELLDMQTEAEYRALVDDLPPPLREALERCVFEDWIAVKKLEKRHRITIAAEVKGYSSYYGERFSIVRGSRFEGFDLDETGSHIALPGWLRELFIPFVAKPAGWVLHPLAAAPERAWSVDGSIADILPLFRKALRELLATFQAQELVRKGLKKGELGKLRALTGLPAFEVAAGRGLDSAEVLARFLAAFDLSDTAAEGDSENLVKTLVQYFFKGRSSEKAVRSQRLDRQANLADTWFDQAAFLDHLSRRSGYSLALSRGIPSARRDFRMGLDLIEGLGTPGAWVDARALFDTLCIHLATFRVTDEVSELNGLGIKAETLSLNGLESLKSRYEPAFVIGGIMRRDCIARPIFENYAYLFASLGILEIAEAEPPLPLMRKGKPEPISPADCLAALRLTPLGRWCLGYAKERPTRPEARFEALADQELLLVTFRGRSLERRLFLDLVATPLGAERWRFTEARFIAGCDSPKKIEARIEDFKRLIDPEPSPHWRAFFEGILTRAAILPAIEAAFVIPLPPDPAIRRVFTENPRLRALAKRVEDGSVVVRETDLPVLAKLLAGLGFWAPEAKKIRRRRDEEP